MSLWINQAFAQYQQYQQYQQYPQYPQTHPVTSNAIITVLVLVFIGGVAGFFLGYFQANARWSKAVTDARTKMDQVFEEKKEDLTNRKAEWWIFDVVADIKNKVESALKFD